MREINFISCLFLYLLISFTTVSQEDTIIKKIIQFGKTDNQTMFHQDILCNRIGGRPIGSDAYENACEWAASKFREWGMEVIMDEVGSLPVGFNRGPWFGQMLGQNGMSLHFATPSYTVGTKGLQKGYVLIEPKTPNQLNRMKGKLKGAWVLISGKNNGWPIDFSSNADSVRNLIISENIEIERKNDSIRRINWNNRQNGIKPIDEIPLKEEPALFYKEMVELGILGIIQSAPVPITALYDRKNIDSLTFYSLPSIPDIKLDEHQYKIIEEMVRERRTIELEFDIRNHFRPGPIKYHNVIGVIKGTEYPDEYVIMGGHLDAFDVATGGVDDGSGVGPSMEAARLLMKAGAKPKRTILVCLWAGEEFGLLGSKSWVNRNELKLDKISNMFNRDGGPTVANSLSVTEAMWNDFTEICRPLNDINPEFPFKLIKREASEKPMQAWGTDSGPFAVKGVPTLTFGTEDTKGYNFSYAEIWHTERDLYSKSIAEYQEHTSIVTAIVVYGVSMLDHLLSREGLWLPAKSDNKELQNKSRKSKK